MRTYLIILRRDILTSWQPHYRFADRRRDRRAGQRDGRRGIVPSTAETPLGAPIPIDTPKIRELECAAQEAIADAQAQADQQRHQLRSELAALRFPVAAQQERLKRAEDQLCKLEAEIDRGDFSRWARSGDERHPDAWVASRRSRVAARERAELVRRFDAEQERLGELQKNVDQLEEALTNVERAAKRTVGRLYAHYGMRAAVYFGELVRHHPDGHDINARIPPTFPARDRDEPKGSS